jgi:hypothetical protein
MKNIRHDNNVLEIVGLEKSYHTFNGKIDRHENVSACSSLEIKCN